MIRRTFLIPAILLAISIGSIAIAQTTDSSKAFMAVHEKMMKDMTMSPSGDADKDFAMMMIPHHQGAIDMAEIELKYGKDPDLRKMAEKIIHAQKEEIADFKKWLAKHAM